MEPLVFVCLEANLVVFRGLLLALSSELWQAQGIIWDTENRT